MPRRDPYTGRELEDYDELAYGFSVLDPLDDELDEETLEYLLQDDE